MQPPKMTSKVVYEPSIKSYDRFLIFSLQKNFRGGGREIEKIKFQPRIDQKNATSKNDLKSRLGALNEKL